ncbi:Mobile element protein [Methanosarcina sp. WH1]|nr:Mobile element protein [Methanosarcina sp. WH1]
MMQAFKFRLYPTTTQAIQLNQHIGSCRFVYNWALDQKIKTYEQTGESISRFDLNKLIPTLKASNEWLGEVNSQSLQGMTKQLNPLSLDSLERKQVSKVQIKKIRYSLSLYLNTTL